MNPLDEPKQNTGDPVLDFFSTVTDWIWIAVVGMVGFMFRKLFNHDTQLGDHNTQIALLEQQGNRFEEYCIAENERREEQRAQALSTIEKQHQTILAAIAKLK